ncbi:hypothetical protein [Actinacidiphila yeochonensis]|uniref:hypothetical protein n=1 Tax=Actinacidiphila yeochonensis TaxID=89050 RepID=UPI00056485C1|nr:hypothetical protein [Actinacidiphila yeochonensis]
MTHVVLDGTLIRYNRLAGVRDNGNDWWFSQKRKACGGNVHFLSQQHARHRARPTDHQPAVRLDGRHLPTSCIGEH